MSILISLGNVNINLYIEIHLVVGKDVVERVLIVYAKSWVQSTAV